MNIKQIIMVGVAGMAMGAMALDNVEVTDVKARQRYPWNGKVDIDFTLDSRPTEPYQMQVEVYDNVGKTNLPVKSVCTEGVSVEANPCMVRTDTQRIVWDAAKDLPNGFKCTNVLVTCRDARLIPVDKLYCVIDLKTGAKTYLDKVPAGGWTDEHKTTKMVFRRIEACSFMMGSPATEAYRESAETYKSTTISKPFYIAIFELTEGQQAFGGNSGLRPKLLRYGEITSFISSLNTKVGNGTFALPTEAQWECACRGQTTLPVNSGDVSSAGSLNKVARWESNTSDGKGDSSCKTYTHVGCYMPNAFGLYDMLGNARELCQDRIIKGGGVYHYVGKSWGLYDDWEYGEKDVMQGSMTNCRAGWRATGGAYEYYPGSSGYGPYVYTEEGVRLVFSVE